MADPEEQVKQEIARLEQQLVAARALLQRIKAQKQKKQLQGEPA